LYNYLSLSIFLSSYDFFLLFYFFFFFSSRRRHTRSKRDWSSDVCSSDLKWVRFHVKANGETSINGLIQDARLIDADLSFDNLDISQKNTEDFNENWTQGADTITIEDAS